jgi:hypothetical protein
MKYILLVTWISGGHPPVNYQVFFNSAEACETARQAVLADAQRVKAQQAREGGEMGQLLAMQLWVSAVCAAQ